ncbi:hypothetical protein ACFPAF_04140 [Hymenobacter endophyticus]|uniref:Uncharacterized protein n=1 Tax=Hymenobacter endophyticus TaxID=3076335 RepID=A0ABU3TDX6_9BACT|nr:hypothetical protein [Hymenobacter endophyticus]MDU0369574.1 hypothetical protein [Hymenobacter endophyticus]
MKKLFGLLLIVVAILSVFRYPNLGRDMAETAGAMLVFALLVFFGYRLMTSKSA